MDTTTIRVGALAFEPCAHWSTRQRGVPSLGAFGCVWALLPQSEPVVVLMRDEDGVHRIVEIPHAGHLVVEARMAGRRLVPSEAMVTAHWVPEDAPELLPAAILEPLRLAPKPSGCSYAEVLQALPAALAAYQAPARLAWAAPLVRALREALADER